jgi:High potential iron-sulfur protein
MLNLNESTRRRFLGRASIALAAALGLSRALAKTPPKKSDAPEAGKGSAALVLVDEKSSLAVTLKYASDASTVPAGLKVAKAGVDGANQNCANCMFYTKSGKVGSDEVGKCQLLVQGVVKGKGWCSSWTKKA